MRGTILKRAKGSWTIIIDVGKHPDGRRKQQWITVKGSKRDAERRLAEVLNKVNGGLYIRPSKDTLGSFLDTWLRDHISTRVRPTTLDGYRWRAQSIIKALGHHRLCDLEPQHIQAYHRSKLDQGLSPATIVKHHNLLRSSLATAVRWKLIEHNVAELVDPPRPESKEMRALSEEEANLILDSCKETRWYPVLHTLIWTGLRRSEVLGLRWQDVDLDAATLRITSVLHHLDDGSFVQSRPKTPRSRRQVALLPSSCQILRTRKATQEDEARALGVDITPETLVFSHPDGSPIRPGSVTQAFSRIAGKTGLSRVRLHDLRHTHATLLMKMNVHPKVVSERLGHSSTRLTMDTYSHVLPGMQASAVAGLEGVLAPKVAMSPAVSRLLARLIDTGPGKIPWRIAVPRNSPLLRTATASAGQLQNLLNWIMKAAAWPFHTVG